MVQNALSRSGLSAVAAACLISVALPATAVTAKEKTKPAATEAMAQAEPEPGLEFAISIPSIETVDSSISDAVLEEIFRGDIAAHADELAGLDATSITVPEIVVSFTSDDGDGSQEMSLTFTDLVLSDVADGLAAGVSLASVSMVADDIGFDYGSLTMSNLDIDNILGIFGLVDHGGQTELETIFSDFVFEGGTLEADDLSCTYGGGSGTDYRARPLRTSFAEMMAITAAMEDDPETLDPALMGRFLKMYADVLTAFSVENATVEGFSCEGTDDGQEISFSIGGMTMGGMSPGVYPSISMDGFDIAVEEEGSITLANVTIKPMDLTTTIATLEAAPDLVDEAWLEANARSLIPAMEGFSMSGLDIDIPDPDAPDTRIQAMIGAFDLSLADYINGIPTDFDMSATNIQAEIPADSGDESLDQLRSFGITAIDAGFRVAGAWDAETETIAIEEMSMSGVDLASVLLAGTISNATEDLFALDMNAALAAGMALAVSNLDLTVTDAGLSDIILAVAAADQGTSPEALRPIFAGLAQGTVIGMMAGAADAAKLGETINAFVSGKAKTLMIGIEAKTEPGLGMMDFMAAEQDPASLLGKVNISAEAK